MALFICVTVIVVSILLFTGLIFSLCSEVLMFLGGIVMAGVWCIYRIVRVFRLFSPGGKERDKNL